MSAKRDLRVYLEDIFHAIEQIETYTIGGKSKFYAETMIQDAVLRQLAVIGEAASKLSRTFHAKYPDIPWKQIVGMRNILIHDYAETNIRIVWMTVERDLPILKHTINGILREEAA